MRASTLLSPLFAARRVLALGALAAAAAGCTREADPPAPAGLDYYPVAIGDFRVYDVVDTLWNRSAQPSSVERYQLRERVEEEFQDAAGKKAFRIVRSKRATAAAAWRDDSVLVVAPSARNLQLTAFNRRTVELVFPVRDGYEWDRDAFNPDGSTANGTPATNRAFVDVGKPFSVAWGGRTLSYPATATVYDRVQEPNCNPSWRRQVYAQGQGPVFRQYRNLSLNNPDTGTCLPAAEYVFRGRSRTEVLVEQGKL